MNNFSQNGKTLPLVAPRTVTSGQGAMVGSQFGVATSDVTSGATGEFLTEGVVSLAKTSAQAWTQGQKIYWDDTNHRCDSDGTLGMMIGVATAAAANPSSTGYVKLTDAPGMATGPQTAVATVATANATDLATAEALANQLKTSFNALLVSIRAAGVILP